MDRNRITPNPTQSISPSCNCCFPPQLLTVVGQRAHCPLTEKLYEDTGDGNFVRFVTNAPTAMQAQANPPEWQTDFYPGRRQRGEVAPLSINPAEDRFGA